MMDRQKPYDFAPKAVRDACALWLQFMLFLLCRIKRRTVNCLCEELDEKGRGKRKKEM